MKDELHTKIEAGKRILKRQKKNLRLGMIVIPATDTVVINFIGERKRNKKPPTKE
jgi:hypothetical protein